MVRLFPLIVSFWIGEARSYKISVVGNNWLVGWLADWLVGNAVFSETAIRIFLTFWMKLADYKGRKFKKPEFWKKFFDWRYSRKGLQISQLTIFFIFGLKLVLNMTFNVNETYFSEKKFNLGIFDLKLVQKLLKLRFLAMFSTSIISFLWFLYNDRWAWCLVAFLQFTGPVNVFLLWYIIV